MVSWIKDDIGLEWFRIDVIWVRVYHHIGKEEINCDTFTIYSIYSGVN
jgi:hypothetical protein